MNPEECKYYFINQAGGFVYACKLASHDILPDYCKLKAGRPCPDFTPKTERDENKNNPQTE